MRFVENGPTFKVKILKFSSKPIKTSWAPFDRTQQALSIDINHEALRAPAGF